MTRSKNYKGNNSNCNRSENEKFAKQPGQVKQRSILGGTLKSKKKINYFPQKKLKNSFSFRSKKTK